VVSIAGGLDRRTVAEATLDVAILRGYDS